SHQNLRRHATQMSISQTIFPVILNLFCRHTAFAICKKEISRGFMSWKNISSSSRTKLFYLPSVSRILQATTALLGSSTIWATQLLEEQPALLRITLFYKLM